MGLVAVEPSAMEEIPAEYEGWWRIVEVSQWRNLDVDILGPALLSLTEGGGRLRMFVLLAYVQAKPTKAGVSFTWQGAWEFDEMSGTGSHGAHRGPGGQLAQRREDVRREGEGRRPLPHQRDQGVHLVWRP